MFIGRKGDGSIYGAWVRPQPKDHDHPNVEELPDDHPDVVAFLNRPIVTPRQKVDILEETLTALDGRLKAIEARGQAVDAAGGGRP